MSLDANYIVGLVDATGSFQVGIVKSNTTKTGFQILLKFAVSLSKYEKKLNLLMQLRNFFNVGKIIESKKLATYIVEGIDEILGVIIPFFDAHKLILKAEDFEVWKQIAFCMKRKEHLDWNGLKDNVIPLIEKLYSLRKEKRSRKMLSVLKRKADIMLKTEGEEIALVFD